MLDVPCAHALIVAAPRVEAVVLAVVPVGGGCSSTALCVVQLRHPAIQFARQRASWAEVMGKAGQRDHRPAQRVQHRVTVGGMNQKGQ